MSATVLYMSMSVDGFITGPERRAGNGLGRWPTAFTIGCEREARMEARRAFPVAAGTERRGVRRDADHRRGPHRPADVRPRGRLGRRSS